MEAQDFIYSIEKESKFLSRDIIDKVCNRAIRKMNRLPKAGVGADDFPSSFSFFDVISVLYQRMTFDEINPYLMQYICDTLDGEREDLTPAEQFVLQCSNCSEHNACDIMKVRDDIFDRFLDLLEDHYRIRKIQKFVEKW